MLLSFMLLLPFMLLLLLLAFLLLWEIRSFIWLVEMGWLLILICVMKRTTDGWKLYSKISSLKHASCIVITLSMDAICTSWIAWTVLFALSVSKTTKTIMLFRYHFLSLNLKFSSLLSNLFVWGRGEKRNRLSRMHILCCSFSVSSYAPPVNNCIHTN